ncbi:Flavin monooxygenase FMO family and Flavin monooxygenase (FMO) 5 family and Dimethylaniline monooxygenase, N-oxide-forming family and Flavin monooxygenase-like family-containing protein [Strongyloides ratti]|uniref:Flavin-containing monooxygenase n=1 Tax=Strongyloides ratti TaxID=34506 RepID=A0A090KTW1_STRRB|nr:Flavin monooxygenase FMO family and Flavin monooxygenase (FMO) 5 family and Dimethylaniline monooxygenase, N-oxide-forming family and Flavin monooxygenase-like family-containing protein [Strongyloides ratti]CEF59285.1 Flavin monooxygenase FMO family and Flavin monooxygenase (FMO) 5 family and Dimethylaniline monooxygenase, N-oxide-forming family and Flavin monooxygenase-like family-containing protein [Strongyloides ratti]
MEKKIAIIGAGASGLTSARHALLNNYCPVIFESSTSIGGLWKYKPEKCDDASVMKTTVINTSKEMTAFSDFPPSKTLANFMHNTEMYKYLENYANEYNLVKYIKFNHKVQSIFRHESYDNTGNWVITYSDNNNKIKSEVFNGVLLCTGHHKIPNWPEKFPGQDKFKGKITHAHNYKDHRGYEDKIVVVVGVGNSGGDIAVELSRISKSVNLVTRRGTWVFNRIFDFGVPFDIVLNRRFLFSLKRFTPSWLNNAIIESKLTKRFDHKMYGLQPKHRVLSAHPTVNDELPNRLACGTIKIRPNIKCFGETFITFEDGTILQNVDEVIFCTGYNFDFKIIEDGNLIPVIDNNCSLYKYMYPLETTNYNNLAIIGLIQPYGSIMPISEMQARLFFETLSGRLSLPSKKEMLIDINKKKEVMSQRYYKSKRHTIQVDYMDYMDEIAEMIKCKPNPIDYIFNDFKLFYALLFGPNVPYAYRLKGPHPWKEARNALLSLNERTIYPTYTARKMDIDECSRKFVLFLSNTEKISFILLCVSFILIFVLFLC